MSEELQRAISAGVVKQTQGGYRCTVCDKDVTDLLPHLRGKDHFNNLAWEALRNPAPHSVLLDALPPVVREAKARNELEQVDKAFFSYRCRVCPRKPLSNGIKSLETHLNGKDHEKAKMIPPHVHLTHPGSVHQPPSNQRPGIQWSLVGMAPQNPDPQLCQFPGSQPPAFQQPPYPLTDSLQLPYPSTNPEPSPVRTPAPQPAMPLYNPQPQPPPRIQYPTSSQPPASTLLPTSTTGAFPPNPSLAVAGPQPSPSGDLASAAEHDPELQRALAGGVVEKVGDGPAYRCRACEKNVTGRAPCLEHLKSDKHKKKAQAWTNPPLPDIGGLQLRGDDGLPQRIFQRCFESLPMGVGRRDQVDGSWDFPWEVVPCTQDFPPTERVYRNLSMPRGLVLIFNYYFTGQGRHERTGARRDSFNLRTLFHRIGYQVYLYEDYSKSQTEKVLTDTQNNPSLREYDSFIVFILSHGKDDQTFFTASGREEDCMKLDDVRYRFTDFECPALKDKPKLFFVNFCRGQNLEPQTAYDGIPPKHSPKDMVTLYSCINTFKTPRDPQKGTVFVQVWCQVLAAHAHNEELRDLHQIACQHMLDMKGSLPELQDYFFKKFYFNPVRAQ